MPNFNHLHCHSQFSLLDGAASIAGMMKKAKADGMTAVALTDHGNMFGAFKFVYEADKAGIKPIVGCEFYLVEDRHKKKFEKGKKDERYHQLLLAKNMTGYQNLAKLCSLGYIEGFYSKYPRIDKELLLKYHEGLIATSCCIGATVPQTILHEGEEAADKELKWWVDLFGREDFYIELQRHGLENIDGTGKSQEDVNQILLRLAKKHDLKVICTNDSHYLDQKDSEAHDILLCINTGSKKSDPTNKGEMQVEGKEEGGKKTKYRFAFPNNEFFFKTQAQMNKIFADVPQALDFTCEIADKVEKIKLKRDILMPNFPVPPQFSDQFGFLKHLTFEGAKRHYGSINADIEERLNFELETIQKMGFAGYFLIVQDFINSARKLDVWVGPGRGSAAGSAVAYCVGITNIDPIKYELLFERFLNPERVSMPDIDVDFDDEGRQKVIDYVVDKYGKSQVAQIATYGTMAARMSIKDVARVLDLPLDQANYLAKLVPEKPGTKLSDAFQEVPELAQIIKSNDERAKILEYAHTLEGSVRGTGIHAAGVIIAPDDITNYVPVCVSKDSDLYVTQFEGKVIEEAGMLKMDFLGLKTLTVMRDAIKLIRKNHKIEIDVDAIPLDDKKTYELYQKGDTIGTFQFESVGMQKYLKELKPNNIEDLIAMNALYRPGPLQFIPVYIDRKHGREPVEYPHALLEPVLKNTYGIMVYQEQIMLTARILGGYSLGGADLLRRAMGKKDREKMAKEKDKFVEGAKKLHNIPEAKAADIFGTMERFAEYGFNHSHSAAYSVLAYQTAYLKAHYPAEYMSAVMTHSMGDIEKISFFLEETKRMGVTVLGPDVNESSRDFDVNKKGQIRFGLGAIKGTGEAAVEGLIEERTANGNFTSVWNLAERVNLRTVNKKTFESLAYAGGFDSFEDFHRAQYFHADPATGIEKVLKYGANKQSDKGNENNILFGGAANASLNLPKLPDCEVWTEMEKLKHEKEVVGFYLTGHPLNQYETEIKGFCNTSLAEVPNMRPPREIKIAGILSNVQIKQSKNGNQFASFNIEDFEATLNLALFGEDFLKFRHLLVPDQFLYIRGKMQERYNQPNQFEMRINNIELLNEVMERYGKEIEIRIKAEQLTSSLITDLQKILDKNKGNCRLRIPIMVEGQEIKTVARNFKIRPSKELMAAVRGLDLEMRVG